MVLKFTPHKINKIKKDNFIKLEKITRIFLTKDEKRTKKNNKNFSDSQIKSVILKSFIICVQKILIKKFFMN